MINAYPVWNAFEALTGFDVVDPKNQTKANLDWLKAYAVMAAAIIAVINRHREKTRWLREARWPTTRRSHGSATARATVRAR
jgi:hypothetical protein